MKDTGKKKLNPETESKTKPKKKHSGLVRIDFKIDGKSYRTGKEYSTTDKHRFERLLKLKYIVKK